MARKSSNVSGKPLYKKWWFWVIVVLVIGVFGNLGSSDKDSADTKKTDDKKTEVSTKESKTKKEDKKDLVVDIADSFDTDGSGNVTITGKTEPKAKVQIGFGVLNDPAEADDNGNFTLTYSLTSAKDKKINIFVSLDGNTGSKDIIIKPSAEFKAAKESNNDDNTQKANDDSSVPTEYKSALRKAENYSSTMKMSKAGIYDQLTSEYGEKFPPEAAQYAIDNMQADWNANALAKAKSYQESMAMSTEAIRDQLTSEHGEKFTPEEAEYAIQNLGQ